jgi:hypothetical protein
LAEKGTAANNGSAAGKEGKRGNPKNLCLAGSIGRLAQAQAANELLQI